MKIKLKTVVFTTVLMFVAPAHGDFLCVGKVSYLGVGSDGRVFVRIADYPTLVVCNITSPLTSNGATIAIDVCRTWYSSLLVAQKSKHAASFTFPSATVTGDNPSACGWPASWAIPNPLPIGIGIPSE